MKVIAPFVPFVAENIWQNLIRPFNASTVESVHLADYPTPNKNVIDEELSRRMNLLREIASLGLSARMNAN